MGRFPSSARHLASWTGLCPASTKAPGNLTAGAPAKAVLGYVVPSWRLLALLPAVARIWAPSTTVLRRVAATRRPAVAVARDSIYNRLPYPGSRTDLR